MYRILIVLSTTDRGGVEVWLSRVLNYLPSHEYEIHLLTRSSKEGHLEKEFLSAGIKVHRAGSSVPFFYLMDAIKLNLKYDYSLVHLNLAHRSALIAILFKFLGKRIIFSIHNSKIPKSSVSIGPVNFLVKTLVSLSYRITNEIADTFTGCSEDALDGIRMLSGYNGVAINLPYGVDVNSISKREGVRIQNEAIKLICVGSLTYQKNYEFLLRSLAKAKFSYTCDILGEGLLRQDLETLSVSLGLNNKVRFQGNVPDVMNRLRQADILLMVSHYEGLPVALLEAMSTGIPILASNVDGIRMLIKHERTGLLFEANNTQDFLLNLNQLRTSEELRKVISNGSRMTIEKKFSIQQSARILTSIYENRFK